MWHHPAILPDSIPFDSEISLLRIHPKNTCSKFKNEVRYTRLFITAVLVVTEDQKSQMAIIGDWVNKPRCIHTVEYYLFSWERKSISILYVVITRIYHYV